MKCSYNFGFLKATSKMSFLIQFLYLCSVCIVSTIDAWPITEPQPQGLQANKFGTFRDDLSSVSPHNSFPYSHLSGIIPHSLLTRPKDHNQDEEKSSNKNKREDLDANHSKTKTVHKDGHISSLNAQKPFRTKGQKSSSKEKHSVFHHPRAGLHGHHDPRIHPFNRPYPYHNNLAAPFGYNGYPQLSPYGYNPYVFGPVAHPYYKGFNGGFPHIRPPPHLQGFGQYPHTQSHLSPDPFYGLNPSLANRGLSHFYFNTGH